MRAQDIITIMMVGVAETGDKLKVLKLIKAKRHANLVWRLAFKQYVLTSLAMQP